MRQPLEQKKKRCSPKCCTCVWVDHGDNFGGMLLSEQEADAERTLDSASDALLMTFVLWRSDCKDHQEQPRRDDGTARDTGGSAEAEWRLAGPLSRADNLAVSAATLLRGDLPLESRDGAKEAWMYEKRVRSICRQRNPQKFDKVEDAYPRLKDRMSAEDTRHAYDGTLWSCRPSSGSKRGRATLNGLTLSCPQKAAIFFL